MRRIITALVFGIVVTAAVLPSLGRAHLTAPPVSAGNPPDIHLRGGPLLNFPGPSTGNTFKVEISGLSPNLSLYSVVGGYNRAVIDVTAVTDTSGVPSLSCPGYSTDYGGGAAGTATDSAFELTCGTTAASGFPTGPVIALFTVTFDCLAGGTSTVIGFDDAAVSGFTAPGAAVASAEGNHADLAATHTNGIVYCGPGCVGDFDCDSMPDAFEGEHACLDVLTNDSIIDGDSDGLSNLSEYQRGTDPCNPDGDGDHCRDGIEVAHQGVKKPDNPLDATDFPDVDASGKVAAGDFSLLLAHWNTTPSSAAWWAPIDLNHGGKVNVGDFSILLKAWNRTCP